jgi:GlcNAc-P-P-Und epimerase
METVRFDRARILVTGGSGFIGTNVVQHYLDRGVGALINADVATPKVAAHSSVWRRVDVTDRQTVIDVFDELRPTHLLHMAARTDLHGRSLGEYAANVAGQRNVVDAAMTSPSLEASVFVSSRMVCEIGYLPEKDDDYCPPNYYGESKVEGELMVRSSDIEHRWTLVRPTSIWGPYFGVPYRDFFGAVLAGRYMHPRGEIVEKSFGFVGNTVHQLVQLLHEPLVPVHGKTLYVADYEPLNMLEFAQEVSAYADARRVRTAPVPLLRAVALIGDALQRARIMRDAPLTSFRLANLRTQMVYDLSELSDAVGPLPYTHTEGVLATLKYMGVLT